VFLLDWLRRRPCPELRRIRASKNLGMMKRISVYGRRPGEKSEDMIMTTLHMGTELEERWSGMGWKEKKKKNRGRRPLQRQDVRKTAGRQLRTRVYVRMESIDLLKIELADQGNNDSEEVSRPRDLGASAGGSVLRS
jgi:hypothetical protein